MTRLARAVVPGIPHHITQRGNRRQEVFFGADDYGFYRGALAERCADEGVEVLAYCLMPNHVHLILVPPDEGALAAVLARLHRDYARRINFREDWRGYLWQGRFASFAMDEDYLLACARYVELNPVRARLVAHPADWPWSSAAAHLTGKADRLVRPGAWMARAGDWAAHLGAAPPHWRGGGVPIEHKQRPALGCRGLRRQARARSRPDAWPAQTWTEAEGGHKRCAGILVCYVSPNYAVCTRVGVSVTHEMAEFCGCDAVDGGKYDGVHVGGLSRFYVSPNYNNPVIPGEAKPRPGTQEREAEHFKRAGRL